MKEKKDSLLKSFIKILEALLILATLVLLYPFWLLFAKIANYIGFKNMRNVDGKLQTPIVYYENPQTNRVVVFIATFHYADAAYYAAIQEVIDSLKGYKVLYEGVGKLSSKEELSLTMVEQKIAEEFNKAFQAMEKIGSIMELTNQRDGLAYNDSWLNTDMSMYHMIWKFGQKDLNLLERSPNFEELLDDKMEHGIARWLINILLNRAVPLAVILNILMFFSKNNRDVRSLVLDARNEIAIDAIFKNLIDGNVATIWGAGHLPGIEKILVNQGFREVRRDWFTVYTKRKYSVLDTFKDA